MLDPRAQTLLKTLIERYIAEGQPVGSRTLSRYSGLELSPATIRNVMSDLEELGLVVSPHTSAGRIPTPRGYRLLHRLPRFSDAIIERIVDRFTAAGGQEFVPLDTQPHPMTTAMRPPDPGKTRRRLRVRRVDFRSRWID